MTTALHASKAGGGQRKARPAAKPPKARKSRHPAGMPHETSQDPRVEFSDEEWHDMVAAALSLPASYESELQATERVNEQRNYEKNHDG